MADKVIVTVPLGVLQAKSITFIPSLAKSKIDAINRLGWGFYEFLWLEFSSVFWTKVLNSDYIQYLSETPGQWAYTINYYKFSDQPILSMINSA